MKTARKQAVHKHSENSYKVGSPSTTHNVSKGVSETPKGANERFSAFTNVGNIVQERNTLR
jgi:hypothetical protein